jgi:hypothetical protein
MLYIREKLRFIEAEWGKNEHTKKAAKEIHKAQCNDPYWHGQFGGVYFAFMRHNVYSYLIEAERMIDKIGEGHTKITPAVVPYDIDKDGREEILLETSLINMYFHPFRGGSLYEIDHKAKSINILNTFQRRKEAYYTDEMEYIVDRWRRHAFYDHFIEEKVTLEDVYKDIYGDLGNFLEKHYEVEVSQTEKIASVRLCANGEVLSGNDLVPVRMSKFFEVFEDKNEIRVTLSIENKGETPLSVYYLTEIPIYLTGDINSLVFKYNKEESDILAIEECEGKNLLIQAADMDVKVKLTLSKACTIYKYSLQTFAKTNGGDDSLYQGTVLGLRTPVQLEPGEIESCKINISLE